MCITFLDETLNVQSWVNALVLRIELKFIIDLDKNCIFGLNCFRIQKLIKTSLNQSLVI
jgi:hypothetical protein